MTAIVGVLNSQGIAIAADSAVTVTGNTGKKVYNKSNKIFTLSKLHPVGIAIYSSADYLGIPLETLIKMYRKKLSENSFDSLAEYKEDFIQFLKEQIVNVSDELKRSSFFAFCNEAYNTLLNNTLDKLRKLNLDSPFENLPDQEKSTIYSDTFTAELEIYSGIIEEYAKSTYSNLSYDEYCVNYADELDKILDYIKNEIEEEFEGFVLTTNHKDKIKNILYSLINIEYIFEKHCGLVFFGFGDKEVFPSSHLVLIGHLIGDVPRIKIADPVEIKPGINTASNIIPYAQADVTTTVLTGVDPNYKNEVQQSIKKGFNIASEKIETLINDTNISLPIKAAMQTISEEMIQELEDYQWRKITGPLLETLAHMGKEDMSELAESLVNITSLKRKFTSLDSSDESVGGPVDVAIVTKGDGFIWIKRKHYFDIENNPSFRDKYFKI